MVYILIGTKAQLVKMAPVMKALQEKRQEYLFIHTGQHKETMDDMYQDFGIKKPDVVLYEGPDITSVKQTVLWLLKLLWRSSRNRKVIFPKKKKSIVLVHGDTLSTLAGALIGRFTGITVGHVESGLRSYNLFHPFPEEITRILVIRLSQVLFCPGSWALKNVESMNKKKVDTQFNTLLDTVNLSKKKRSQSSGNLSEGIFSLVSLHRYENIFKMKQLLDIVVLLEKIAKKHHLIFILHPPTKKQLKKFGLYNRLESNPNITCENRFPHSVFLQILLKAEFVITDGGSLQEECSYLGVPCLLYREATERKEGMGKNVVLSGREEDRILDFIKNYKEYVRQEQEDRKSPSIIISDYLADFA